MNKKQLIVTSVLLSLMFVLIITQSFFNENFERLNSNNINTSIFTEYKINDNKCSISIPSKWSVQEENNEGAYVSSVLRFKGINDKIDGLVQVINTDADIEVFADRDIKNQTLKYYNQEVAPYKNLETKGVLVKYNTSIKDSYQFKNECYYIELEGGKIMKVLFNIGNESDNLKVSDVCNSIISSIKQYK